MAGFLPKEKRIPVSINDISLKRIGDTKRMTMDCSVDLSDDTDTLAGMAGWIQNSYTLMQKLSNKQKSSKFEEVIQNLAIEIWPTPKARRRFFPPIVEATISKFEMDRTGKEDETAKVKLYFTVEFIGRKEIHDWAWDHRNAKCWMNMEQQQGELNYNPEVPNGSSQDDDEDEDEEKYDDDEGEDVEDDDGDFEDDDDE